MPVNTCELFIFDSLLCVHFGRPPVVVSTTAWEIAFTRWVAVVAGETGMNREQTMPPAYSIADPVAPPGALDDDVTVGVPVALQGNPADEEDALIAEVGFRQLRPLSFYTRLPYGCGILTVDVLDLA